MAGAGCATPTATPIPERAAGVVVPGVTAQGAVITRCDGQALYYRKQCATCKFIAPQPIGMTFVPAPWTCRSDFACPQCGAHSAVLIRRMALK